MPNSIVMLAADSARWKDLESTTRSYLAWKSILDDKLYLDLTHTNEAQAQRQVETTNRTIGDQIAATWIWGLHATQPDPAAPFGVGQQKCDGQEKLLAHRVPVSCVRICSVSSWRPLSCAWTSTTFSSRMEHRQDPARRPVGLLCAVSVHVAATGQERSGQGCEGRAHDADSLRVALAQSYDEETGLSVALVPIEDLDFGTITDTRCS